MSAASEATDQAALKAARLPIHITPQAAMSELAGLRRKLAEGAKRLGAFTEDDLAIATTPADEVYREDMMRLYKCRPAEGVKQKGIAVLILTSNASEADRPCRKIVLNPKNAHPDPKNDL